MLSLPIKWKAPTKNSVDVCSIIAGIFSAHWVLRFYECGMIKRGNKWYSCNGFPTWEGGDTYSFSCMNSAMHANGGNVSYPSIAGIEFVLDTKQDYEYPEDHYSIRLEGEVGEITVYDETHFYYNGVYYLVTSEDNFYPLYN